MPEWPRIGLTIGQADQSQQGLDDGTKVLGDQVQALLQLHAPLRLILAQQCSDVVPASDLR